MTLVFAQEQPSSAAEEKACVAPFTLPWLALTELSSPFRVVSFALIAAALLFPTWIVAVFEGLVIYPHLFRVL